MPFIPTPRGVQLEFLYVWSGQKCETVLHFDFGSTPINLTTLTNLGNDLNAWIAAHIMPLLSANIQFQGTRVTDITSSTGPVVETPIGTPVNGSVTDESVVNNAALVVTKRSANRGRSYRGRVYVPGIPKTEEATSVDMTGTDVAAMVAAWVTLIARALANGATLAILSKFAGKVARGAGVLTPVSTFDADTHFDSQRRRLSGRGN